MKDAKVPSIELQVGDKIEPGDLWNPNNFAEWAERERTKTFLAVWSAQADHERKLRGRCALMIFLLAAFQSVSGIALLVGIGLGKLELDVEFLKILYVAMLGEVFGLFFVVARYLFHKPLHYGFESLSNI
ncbi:MAG: hypothetical protein Q7N95_12480, partial [Alphaproteobacteria bacterium]|nr:hypothetical protein [Alphaproteobacteria bacterium]